MLIHSVNVDMWLPLQNQMVPAMNVVVVVAIVAYDLNFPHHRKK